MLIQPIGLLGNQVAESMSHPDARELSSLIINTLGSYELKKGMCEGGRREGMNLIRPPPPIPPSLSLPHSSSFSSVIFSITPLCNATEISFGYLKKDLRLAGKKCLFSPTFYCSALAPYVGFCSWKLRGSSRGYTDITINGRNSFFSL